MKRILLALALVASLAAAVAQGTASKGVTLDEGKSALAKVSGVLSRRHSVELPVPDWKGGQEVHREQVVTVLADWAKRIEPKLRAKMRAERFDKAAISDGLPQAAQADALALIQAGFAAPVGPMIVGPNEGLSPEEFGDAMGYFTARLEGLAALNDPDYTPGISWPF